MEHMIGIIGAEQQEIDLLLERISLTRTVKKAGLTFFCGTLNNCPVVVVRAGVGKVNAAACTQMLIDLFDVTHVINTGAAGSLNADINIGDIVVSTDVIQHDLNCERLGYEPGMIPDTGKYFTADETLRKLAVSCCTIANPDITAWEGRVVTGDQFISSAEQKDYLIKTFAQPYCAEMEGGAIAHVCTLNQVPFLVIRSISDKADGSASMDFGQFSKMASIHSAKLVDALVAALAG